MLEKNILATIAYFNAQEFPLTTFEVWKHLLDLSKSRVKTKLIEIESASQKLQIKDLISCQSGFWFLKGKESLVFQRIKKQKVSDRKIKFLRQWAASIAWIPYIEGICVTGTLAMRRAESHSDWDILVITKKRRIWVARFFLTSWLYIFRKWRHRDYITNRFCLNHFLSEDGLILEEQNEFTAKEVAYSLPILGEKVYRKYLQLNEYWIKEYTPNFTKEETFSKNILWQTDMISLKVKAWGEFLLEQTGLAEILNRYIKRIMIKKINKNPLTHVKGADIRYNDQCLIFLPRPQRKLILEETMQKLTNSR